MTARDEPRADGRRREACAAFLLTAVISAAVSSPVVGEDGSLLCIHDGVEPSGTERLIDEAIRVLEQSGHDPSSYRLELRMEDTLQPDFPGLRRDRTRSVLFVPARSGDLYPVRVHPANPCVVTWVWQPERFTRWQRAVVGEARQRFETSFPDAGDGGWAHLRVLESREWVRIHVDGGRDGPEPGSRPGFSVTLSKTDLSVVDAEPRP